mgnify:CR=1 FL=1
MRPRPVTACARSSGGAASAQRTACSWSAQTITAREIHQLPCLSRAFDAQEGSPARHAAHEPRLSKGANFCAVKGNLPVLFLLIATSLGRRPSVPGPATSASASDPSPPVPSTPSRMWLAYASATPRSRAATRSTPVSPRSCPTAATCFVTRCPRPSSWATGSANWPARHRSTSSGELESPIVLTCTLCVPRAADAVLTWLLAIAR